MAQHQSALDLVRERSFERPVALARPEALTGAAYGFQAQFKGDIFYAVKANPSPWVIQGLAAAGITGFDVASLPEVERVSQYAPGARMAFMHPVKSRDAITRAYFDHGLRTFALDTHDELAKILQATAGARDLTLIVRLAVEAPGAAYSLSGKFGISAQAAPELLLAARRATEDRMGVSFHVGSQCLRPTAYQAAMAQASRALVRAGVFADVIDVGGGFPSIYPGMTPPDLADYFSAIDRSFSEMMVHEATELWCEPGRALVAEAESMLVRVELRKGDALYLNDGAYGSLFDAAHSQWAFPVRAVKPQDPTAALKPYRFYGPTCDSIDQMPGPFWLPDDMAEGDYIEIGMMGAYGTAMTTGFNGFGVVDRVEVTDPPMASMFGLSRRALATPKTEASNVVRLTKAKFKKRRRR